MIAHPPLELLISVAGSDRPPGTLLDYAESCRANKAWICGAGGTRAAVKERSSLLKRCLLLLFAYRET